MFKLELFSVLIVLLLNISCSFAGAIPNKTPTSIGNYEYPKGVYIPSNFTIPDGNVFKFKLYLAGFVWKRCNGTSGQWVGGAVFRSNIPKYDSSTMSFSCITSAPSYNDPTENANDELCLAKNNTGNGAFSDITYIILTEAKGGAAPPNTECGTKYPDGYIYSDVLTATILLYHRGTQ
ncbi:9840_t:CDS:2 [Gigaspora rosea]|nr:9840_t:CDS:2 [Gigaspora rosea]